MKIPKRFRRKPTLEVGDTVKINRKTMRVLNISAHWENGIHTAYVNFASDKSIPFLPVPIAYDLAEGATACCRCCIPIADEESRWVFPSHTLAGPDLLDLTQVPDGDQFVVCNACGPQLRGRIHPDLLSKPGNNTVTFTAEEDERGQS
jgi:hypothetical protein